MRNLRAQVLSSESIQVDWDEPATLGGTALNSDLRYKLFYSKWTERKGKRGEEEDEDEGEEEVDDEEEEDDEEEDGEEEEETQVLVNL